MASTLHRQAAATAESATGVVLAIDYGKKRLGLALSDKNGVTSRPLATWTRTNRRRDLARLRELVRQHEVRRIVVGLPLHLDGTPSEMSEEARRFGARVEKALGLPVEWMDERLSSWEAAKSLRETSSRKPRRAALDDVAAAVILRDYLERARSRAGVEAQG